MAASQARLALAAAVLSFGGGSGCWAGGCGHGVPEKCSGQRRSLLGWKPAGLPLLPWFRFWRQQLVDSHGNFYNWNRIKIRYCDGSSFTGDVEAVETALLSGCSAGGLAAILHCDRFRDLLPATAKVKCFSDAGFFLDGKDISGNNYVRTFYKNVVTLHGSANNLPVSCTSKHSPELQIGKAVGDWFYDRRVPQLIDCPYPCNPTCKNREDDRAVAS
ncbi:hypothetical protein PR202_ga19146 [Eleusine coracana subsp. coracana]|uniref:Pectin acetylesterase n=1 Tax=Eleusine coracana subsp. coracana TaxID=191504 RepID=A0AAV5CUZ1_ELECO|nr:hypothetical protein PR202_ga19146 [Eleusine coracana subsp. coracana]